MLATIIVPVSVVVPIPVSIVAPIPVWVVAWLPLVILWSTIAVFLLGVSRAELSPAVGAVDGSYPVSLGH